MDISVQILKNLVPGNYKETSQSHVFVGEDGKYYMLLLASEYNTHLRSFIEQKISEYFPKYNKYRDDDFSMLIRTPEEVMSDPASNDLYGTWCFFCDDGVVFKNDAYVVIRSVKNPFES